MNDENIGTAGKVWLVGAGCGGIQLLTLKALDCIKDCQVLVYDSLVDEAIVSEAPEDCEKIYVGKRYGKTSCSQEEINRIICLKAKEGKKVVRLKGGDPFVFGRGGEEAEQLIKEGIPFQIVPGISSCIAVPEMAGIPVTHRDISRSFQVITARKSDGNPIDKAVLKGFACSGGTLVVLMGLSLSGYIAASLMEFEMSGSAEAAVISKGGSGSQRVLRTTLESLEEDIKNSGVVSPAVIVIGKTAGCDFSWGYSKENGSSYLDTDGERLKPYGLNKTCSGNSDSHCDTADKSAGDKPQKSGGVLLTGSKSHTDKLKKQLLKYGITAKTVNLTYIKIEDNRDNYIKAIEKIKNGCYTIFTSPNGVDVFFKLLKDNSLDVRRLYGSVIAAVGSGTCEKLRGYGIVPDLVPEKYTVEELAKSIVSDAKSRSKGKNKNAGKTAAAFRSKSGSAVLGEILEAEGFEFSDIKTYSTEPDREAAEAFERCADINKEKYSLITFSSGSGVAAFFDELKNPQALFAEKTKLVCIGAETAKELYRYRDIYKDIIGDKEIIVAKKFSCEGLAQAAAYSLGLTPEQKEI